MIYFFHHYELPVILQQAHFQQFLLRNTQAARELPPATFQPQRAPIRARITQLISAVRPSVTTQTTSSTVNQAATSTSTNTTTTSTVGTSAQPINSTQSSQTVPASMDNTESQTSAVGSVVASSQTNDEGSQQQQQQHRQIVTDSI